MVHLIFVIATAFAAESVYTDLSQCNVFEEEEGRYSRATCGRVDRYELIREYDDEREDISLKWNQRETHLGLGRGGFGHLGPRVEWRRQNRQVYALIARLISQNGSRWYVVRLPAQGNPCVIGEIEARSPAAADAARALADDASRTCR